MNKKWVEVDFEECPVCGDVLECLTSSGKVDGQQHYYDGDEVRCLGDNCDARLQMSCDEGTAWIGEE